MDIKGKEEEEKTTTATTAKNNEMLTLATQCGKILATLLLIYLMGHFGFSFSWILLAFLVWTWRERYIREKNDKFSVVRAFAIDEEKEIKARHQFLPTWVLFPETERAEWLNKIIRQLWPFVGVYVSDYIKTKLEPSLRETFANTLKMSSFKFEVINLGDVPIRIGGVSVFRESVSRHEIIMDMEVYYSGDCYFKVSMSKLKAGIKDIQFHAKVRTVMKPLVNVMPLVGGVQVYFLNVPDINFNLTDIANVFDFPGFADMLRKAITDTLCNMMLLPNKYSMKLIKDVDGILLHYPEPKGVLRINVIEAKELMKKDIGILGKSDPYCKISVAGQEFRTPIINNTVNPLWNYNAEVLVDDVRQQTFDLEINDLDQGNKDDFMGRLEGGFQCANQVVVTNPNEVVCLHAWDKDVGKTDDTLGSFSLGIHEVAKKGTWENWVRLRDAETGQIHLRLTWFSLSSDVVQLHNSFDPIAKKMDLANAVFIVYVDGANNLPNAHKTVSEPSPFVHVTVGDTKHHTKVQNTTNDPVWETGFCFLIKDPEIEDLSLEVVDKKTEKTLGNLVIRISHLLSADHMTVKLQKYPLKNSGYDSTISLALQLKAMVKDSEDESDHHEQSHTVLPTTPKTDNIECNKDEQKPSALPPSLDEHICNVLEPVLKPLNVDPDVIETATRKRNVEQNNLPEFDKFSVQLTLRYSMQRQLLIVVVHKVMNVPVSNQSDLPDPYVKFLLLPDPSKDSKRKTIVVKNNVNPVYDETFEYTLLPSEINNRTLMVSVCSRSSSTIFGRCLTLGKGAIELANLDLSKAITDWFELENIDCDEGGND